MTTITIPKEKIKKQGGVVILSLREYQRLHERAVPIYYLRGEAALNADRLVDYGLGEYMNGRTVKAASLKEALKYYARRGNKKN